MDMKISHWGLTLLIITTNTHAAGFALTEQSGSSMGNANAGVAAVAQDASTIFTNPAGMSYLPDSQLVFATHAIGLYGQLNNNGSIAGAGRPLNGDGGDLGSWSLVPNLFYAQAITPDIHIGLGITAPFGLKTEYDANWLGRFQAIKSELNTININPSIAYKVNDALSFGAGVSAMRTTAILTSAVNLGAAGEGLATIKGNDWGYGFNLGAIYQVTPSIRMGLAYRSKISQTLKGSVGFILPVGVPAATAPDGPVSAGVTLPETLSFSTFSTVNERWDVLTDITWTRWSRFNQLQIVRDSGASLSLTQENWDNTLRFSLGANYHYNENLKLRAGVAYDQDAIKDQFRTARIPGNDRTWLSAGAQYKVSQNSILDFAVSHLFIKDAPINSNQTAVGNGLISGQYSGDANVLSVQLTHNF
jgi:long-chain fatty acid transport protein